MNRGKKEVLISLIGQTFPYNINGDTNTVTVVITNLSFYDTKIIITGLTTEPVDGIPKGTKVTTGMGRAWEFLSENPVVSEVSFTPKDLGYLTANMDLANGTTAHELRERERVGLATSG